MQFTGLETALIAAFSAFTACVGLMIGMSRRFISREECQRQEEAGSVTSRAIKQHLDRMTLNQDMQCRMLRAIVLHMNLPVEIKNEIMNMQPDLKRWTDVS